MLIKSFRDTDLVARVGGDEFYVIMFDCSRDTAEDANKRIQYHIDQHNETNQTNKTNTNKKYTLSLSVGYVYIDEQPKSTGWEALIVEADKAMYAEKAQKKRKLGN